MLRLAKRNFSDITRTILDNKIAVLSLTGKYNALSKNMMDEFQSNIEEIESNKELRVVVLQSAHPKVFCAGADLKERIGMSEQDVKAYVTRLRDTFHRFSKIKIPTIAAINGFALGGGLELALACDIRLATKSSTIGLTETALGIIPGAGGSQRLTRVIGASKAKELIFTASKLTAEESLALGIINHLVENVSELEKKYLELSHKICKNAPLAVRTAKAAIDEGESLEIRKALDLESEKYEIVLKSSDRIEGLKAFVEKRDPNYLGK